MRKTLKQLKIDAKSNKFEARLIEWQGSKDIPPKIQGWRKLSWQGNSLKFTRDDGTASFADVKYSNLIDYNDDILSLYNSLPNNPKEKGEKILVYELRIRQISARDQAIINVLKEFCGLKEGQTA